LILYFYLDWPMANNNLTHLPIDQLIVNESPPPEL